MNENKIEIYSQEAKSGAYLYLDVRAKFLNQDIIIESFLHSQLMSVGPAVQAFRAAAEDVFVIPQGGDLAQVVVRNDCSGPQPLLKGEDLAKKVEATLKKMACLPV